MDHRFFPRLALGGDVAHPRAGDLSRPIPRNITYHQVSPRKPWHPSVPTGFRLDPFIPSSRGPGCDLSQCTNGLEKVPTVALSSCAPKFTGSLELVARGGMEPITHRLLTIPGGLYFKKFVLTWHRKEDMLQWHWWRNVLILSSLSTSSVASSVSPFGICVHTDNLLWLPVQSWTTSIDLSKATRLKDAILGVGLPSGSVDWIIMALRTISPEHRDLRQISIYVQFGTNLDGTNVDVRRNFGEQVFEQWLELDRLLVQLLESHSIRPRILYSTFPQMGKREMNKYIQYLLPETAGRGIIDLWW